MMVLEVKALVSLYIPPFYKELITVPCSNINSVLAGCCQLKESHSDFLVVAYGMEPKPNKFHFRISSPGPAEI